MGNDHLKRLAAPKIWPVIRKKSKFITKPVPGPHGLNTGLPLSVLFKEVLKYCNSTKEVKKILGSNEIKIDGTIRKNFRFPVGVFDTIELANMNEYFRVVLNKKGKISLLKINKEEVLTKPCKIIGKKLVMGKLQLNFFDGSNLTTDKDTYRVGDTVILSLPEKKVIKHIKLDKKSTVFLTGGKHIGEVGHVEDIIEDRIIYKDNNGNLIQTLKKYAFVVGDSKPAITLS